MNVQYRPLERHEIAAAAEVFVLGVNDLARRHGLAAPSYTAANVEPLYAHLQETGIFWVAEEAGRIVVICSGVLRDGIWFLSMFWALPELRLRGVGKPLLERVVNEARSRGARVFCTWSSIDYSALATYMKLGWMPQAQVLTFSGACSREPAEPEVATLSELDPNFAAAVDGDVRGTPRALDHAFFRARPDGSAHQVLIASKPVGYFYASGGVVGPAAWLDSKHGAAVVAAALREAARTSDSVRLMTLGLNQDAIRVALDSGLKLTSTAHFLATQSFGKLDRYLPSGPGLF